MDSAIGGFLGGFLVGCEQKRAIDKRLKRLEAFEALGREPDELKRMIDMLEDPAPLPMTEDYRTSCGLLEEDDLELMPGVGGIHTNDDWEGGI